MSRGKIVLSNILVLLIIAISSLLSYSLAVFVFSILIYTLGHIYSISIEKSKRENATFLFNIVLSALIFFATLYYFHTVVDYNSFALEWKDEYKFWQMSQELASFISIKEIFNETYSYWQYMGLPGYAFYIGSLGHIADNFLDGNNLLFQFLGSILWGSLSTLVLYKIFLLYFNKGVAFKNVLYFSLLSVVFSYSFFFLRDIIIVFFYLLVFNIVLRKFNWFGLLKIGLISFIVWQIRFEHGLFVIVFGGYYIYRRFKSNKFVLILSIISGLIVVGTLFYDSLFKASMTIERYSDFSESSALDVDDSLGKYIYSLPSPIKEIARFFNSQIQPFPSWIALSQSSNVYQGIVNILPIIYSLFWFVVVFSLMKWTIINKTYKLLSKDLILLSLIIFAFLFVVTMGSGGVRRIMCVYPFVYLIYCLCQSNISSKRELSRTKMQSILSYSLLITLYFILKLIL